MFLVILALPGLFKLMDAILSVLVFMFIRFTSFGRNGALRALRADAENLKAKIEKAEAIKSMVEGEISALRLKLQYTESELRRLS